MIYAYDEMYLDDAMKNLGEAADYAASCCNLNIDTFFHLQILIHALISWRKIQVGNALLNKPFLHKYKHKKLSELY